MRINKYIASTGTASRRKADQLVANGNVKVNRVTITEMGYDVKEGDVVEVNGKVITPEETKVYVLLNKPAGIVTTSKDEMDRTTVTDLVTDVAERIYPVGRLDQDTSGLLLLTNDGDLAYKLTHPKHEIYKTYIAEVAGVLSDVKASKLARGVDIGGFVTSPAKVKILKSNGKSTTVEIAIREGKNRQIRKMFKAVGHPVKRLTRVAIGDIKLGRLAEGGYRKLTRQELDYLRNQI